MTNLHIRSDFRWPDTVKVRRARKDYQCEMPRWNPVVEEPTPTGVRLVQKWPARPVRFRRWDGGAVPEGHRDIKARDHYVEEFAEAEPYQAGWHYCRACAIASGIAEETEK